MSPQDKYADVILPVPLAGTFTYCIPTSYHKEAEVGKRVLVPFGAKKQYSGIIYKIHSNKPEGFKIREIDSVLDDDILVNRYQLKFWEWLSEYYLCNIGEIYRAALPSGLKLESETVLYARDTEYDYDSLEKEEMRLLLELKNHDGITIKKIKRLVKVPYAEKWINALINKGLVFAEEEVEQRYKPRKEIFLALNDTVKQQKILNEKIDSLSRAHRQQQLLLTILHLLQSDENTENEVSRALLNRLPEYSHNALKELIKKGILKSYEKKVSRLPDDMPVAAELKKLTKIQASALKNILLEFGSKNVVLLHGITSSGKTEIYFHLIKQQIDQGKQVLYLLPEIALTTQIVRRLREAFGSAVGIYHSRYSDAQRVETYYQMLQQPGDATIHIVLGARSAIFLPFSRLGLIIIDEEHENSYKQIEPAPRYHARDAAIVLGGLHGAKILLGSATPSFESYFNSSSEKYGLVKLNERYLKIELPDIEIANIREEYRKKRMKSHFSPVLLEEIDRILQNKLQVILFQNRRGFSLFLECDDCGWIPSCRSCDVSLTYHKQSNRLVCHYCGYSMNLPAGCPECTSTNLKTKGFGTEKIEDEIGIFFPKARIVRFDLDSARTRKQYEEIIHEFERGRTDILVGTQIISKGLDFDNVGLVGVMNADNLLNFPDFRAYERSFQLIAQVAGRAGRKKAKGRVIIQTSDPKNNVIQNVLSYNYDSFYRNQLLERQRFRYPPYFRLIRISMHHRKSDILNQASAEIASSLRKINDVEVLGPQYPLVGKIKNMFIKDILLKIPRTSSLKETKKMIKDVLDHYKKQKGIFSGVHIQADVDPY